MKVLSLFEQARKESPNSLRVLPLYASVSLREGRDGPVLEAARQLVHLGHADAENIYLLGIALLQIQDYAGAQKTFQKFVGLRPASPRGHLGLGVACLDRSLQLDSRFSGAKHFLGVTARELAPRNPPGNPRPEGGHQPRLSGSPQP